MRIYVAGAGAELPRVERVLARLRAAGWEVTCDWTVGVREAIRLGQPDSAIPAAEARSIAERDLTGVADADVVLFLVPGKGLGAGSWVEYGYALALSRERRRAGRDLILVLASGRAHGSIFCQAGDRRFDRDAEALRFLEKFSAGVAAANAVAAARPG